VLSGLPPWSWILYSSFLFVFSAGDLVGVFLRPSPSVSRHCESILALGVETEIELIVESSGWRVSGGKTRIQLYDHHPLSLRSEGLPVALRLSPRQTVSCIYRAVPIERGAFQFGRVAVWMDSPLGMWRRKVWGAESDEIRIYPNFQSLVRYSLMAMDNRVGQIGIHRYPRRGTGLEFQQLRDYRFGDTSNQINWKATSRRLKLISCEYQEEQNQQIMLLLDCGRRMRSRDDELTHFDHALNAVLLLAHIAVRQGDAVGLMTFGGFDRYLAPRKGVSTVNRLLNTTYDIQPSVYASDLTQALEDCSKRIRKRSLIVLVSNISDRQPDNLVEVAHTLRRHHLVLLASLKEEIIDLALGGEVHDLDSALRLAAAQEYAERRAAQFARLKTGGILCLDTPPSKLAKALANTYLEIKAARML
jgi:uncharacterized protein (DUF58 family)